MLCHNFASSEIKRKNHIWVGFQERPHFMENLCNTTYFLIKSLTLIRSSDRHHPQFVQAEAYRLYNAAVTLYFIVMGSITKSSLWAIMASASWVDCLVALLNWLEWIQSCNIHISADALRKFSVKCAFRNSSFLPRFLWEKKRMNWLTCNLYPTSLVYNLVRNSSPQTVRPKKFAST